MNEMKILRIYRPEPMKVHWPTRGFQQLHAADREENPEMCIE